MPDPGPRSSSPMAPAPAISQAPASPLDQAPGPSPGPTLAGLGTMADYLGCSRTQVQRLIKEGRLRATKDGDGRHCCALDELARVRVARQQTRRAPPRRSGKPVPAEVGRGSAGSAASAAEGELHAAVFADLEEGRSAVQIVIDHKIPAEQARSLVETWKELKGLRPAEPDALARSLAELSGRLGRVEQALATVRAHQVEQDRRLGQLPSPGERCPECGTSGSLQVAVLCLNCDAQVDLEPSP